MSKPQKKKKGTNLLGNLLGGERRRHQVAMITEEGEWNQHESNSGMARVFVIMLLIHVALIGSIIVYDFIGTDASRPAPAPVATTPTTDPHELASVSTPSALPDAIASTADAPPSEIPANGTYTIVSGDSLPVVVAKTGVDAAELVALNHLNQEGANLTPGTILKLPANRVATPAKVATVKEFPSAAAATEPTAAQVIPAQPEMPVAQSIADAPPAPAPSPEPVVVSAPPAPAPVEVKPTPPPAPKPATTSRTHVVAKGDTLYGLSRKYGVTVDAIQKANRIADPTSLQLDAKLVIPAK